MDDSSLILAEPAPTDRRPSCLRAIGLPPTPLPSPGLLGHDGSWVLGGVLPPFPLPRSLVDLDDVDDDGVPGCPGGRGLFGDMFMKSSGTYGDVAWTDAWGVINGDPAGNWLWLTGMTGVAMLYWLGMTNCDELCIKDFLCWLSSFNCRTSFLNVEMQSIKSDWSVPFWGTIGGLDWWWTMVNWCCNDMTIACISWNRSLCSANSFCWDSNFSSKVWLYCSDCCNFKPNSPCAKFAECWILEISSWCFAFNCATWAEASEWICDTLCSAPITLTSATLWASWDWWWYWATALQASARTWDSRACATAGLTPTLKTFSCCWVRWSW